MSILRGLNDTIIICCDVVRCSTVNIPIRIYYSWSRTNWSFEWLQMHTVEEYYYYQQLNLVTHRCSCVVYVHQFHTLYQNDDSKQASSAQSFHILDRLGDCCCYSIDLYLNFGHHLHRANHYLLEPNCFANCSDVDFQYSCFYC